MFKVTNETLCLRRNQFVKVKVASFCVLGVLDHFEGHQGAPVTGLSAHHGTGSIDFGHLFLTSSIDWTIKLWSLKENRPLYSFEDNGDYVYDVAWSPIHPGSYMTMHLIVL